MDYKGKHILVIGAGKSGIGAAHVTAMLGAQVILNDYKDIPVEEETRAQLEKAGVTFVLGRQDETLLDGVDLVVVSPGITLSIPILVAARERQIPICGEIEIAYDVCKAPMLAVTGTNGKTTTTTLLAAVIEQAGIPVRVGGNIGSSLCEEAYQASPDGYVVAEVSSYQLETVQAFKAHGAIVLNVTPDHLQRHKTMDVYQAMKERVFANQSSQDYTILNIDDRIVSGMVTRATGQVRCISQLQVVTDGAYFLDGVCYATSHGQAVPVVSQDDIHIPGAHNIENILAVIALTYAIGIPVEAIRKGICTFTGVEHRIEKVLTYEGVTYYNDSKATNTDSAIKALEAFTDPVILLAGGHDKMTDLTEFMQLVKEKTKALILMGEASDRFAGEAEKAGVAPIYRASTMHEAVVLSAHVATAGDIVLLSPACSSFDWYTCFEERGEDFKKEVRLLEQKG